MRDEGGFTLVGAPLAMVLGIGVLMGTLTLIETLDELKRPGRQRVDANQRARPVMQRIMDQLHSSCVGANVTPIRAGSTGTSVSFLHESGGAVNPTPDRVVISLAGDDLTQSVYPATGGTAPNWTFSSTPSSTHQLLTNVGPGGGRWHATCALPVLRLLERQPLDAATNAAQHRRCGAGGGGAGGPSRPSRVSRNG